MTNLWSALRSTGEDAARDPAPRIDRVASLAFGVMLLALAVMVARVAQLQIAPSPELAAQMQERITRRAVPAVRGDILDRRGRLLATTRFGYRVFVDPAVFPDPPDEAIIPLAAAIDADPGQVGELIITKMVENRERAAAAARVTPVAHDPDRRPRTRLAALVGRESVGPTRAEREAASPPTEATKPLIRYVRVSDILTDEQVEAVKALKIPGVHLEQRSVREYPAAALGASIVGKVGIDHNGLLGAELAHEQKLLGEDGKLLYVRDARGRPLWMGPGSFEGARRGNDLRLSIDMELQRIAEEELERGVLDADAAGGRLLMMDPDTGEILAMVDIVRDLPDAVPFEWEDLDAARNGAPARSGQRRRYQVMTGDEARKIHPALGRNRCVEDIYEPGSTFKPFVWAAVTELGLAKIDEVFDTEGGRWRTSYGRYIEDVVKRPLMTWREVLINSSNIGMIKGSERMSFDQLHDTVRRLGFGSPLGLGLPGEAAGRVTSRKAWSKYTHTSVAFGYEIAVTPVQMVRAFCAFARRGEAAGTLPQARLTALDPSDPDRGVIYRVYPSEVAKVTRETLRHVAAAMEEKMARYNPPEVGWRYSLFGKSGTAEIPLGKPPPGKRRPRGSSGYYDDQYNSSFIGGGPVEDPRLVILVIIDDPGPERIRKRTHYGAAVAGPVVRRTMERSLSYLGVPPSPPSMLTPPPVTPARSRVGAVD